jgi:nitrile hydratase subunit beta
MDGVHDMGGMEGFGAVVKDDVVFHAPWERRAFGLVASTPIEASNTDEFRHAIERLDPAFYLTAGYYGRWLAALEVRLVERRVLSSDEVDARSVPTARPRAVAPIGLPTQSPSGGPVRTVEAAPRFTAGTTVRVRDVHPRGHTRLPRYIRGRVGTVERVHPAFVFPDTHAHGFGEDPQYVYAVAFTAQELWGASTDRVEHVVHVDVWESYLEPA